MRIGELAQLCWSAVDFGHNVIRVVDDSRTKDVRLGKVRTTKSRKSRSIPIHGELRLVLDQLRSSRDAGFAFRAFRGGRLRPRNVLQAFNREVIENLKGQFPSEEGEHGFASGRLHSLRHFFCSRCANRGVPERVLMEWLGHTKSAMVKKVLPFEQR
jgi:integrase